MSQGPVRKSSGTIGKSLNVLEQVAAFERPVRFTEVLAESGFPKATLYRFLQNLTTEGMLTYDKKGQTYSLGVRLVRLAHSAWASSSLAPIATPFLDTLSETVSETIHLAQLDNGQVLYLDKRNPKSPVEMYSRAGKVGPAYCTGVGKAMMAFLPDDELRQVLQRQSFHRFTPNTLDCEKSLRAELSSIRERGYAFDREEHEPGIICVAVPILTRTNAVVGAISVTSTTLRTSLKKLEKLVPEMRDTTENIARSAEFWRFPVKANSN